jgi:Zn-dependent protease with chaperone function
MVLVPALAGRPLFAAKWSADYEKKVGAEAAAEAEKQYKLVADDARIKSLSEMANRLARTSDRPEVVYSVKILDADEVNAFALPGGFVYVTKGLLKDIQSDDELAGVIAHEIAHNCGYDGLERAEKSQKLFMGGLAATLVAVLLGGGSSDIGAVLQGAEFVRMGVLSHYSIDYEKRADRRAVRYMTDSKAYNPVGLLTFMERLAAKERHGPTQALGIYSDHPDTSVRVSLLMDYLESTGLEINRRAVTKWDPPQAAETEVDGKKLATLSLWGVTILQTTHPADAPSAMARANGLSESLRQSLAGGLEPYEVSVLTSGSQPQITLRGVPWLTVNPEDVMPPDTTPEAATRRIAANLAAAFSKERLGRWF